MVGWHHQLNGHELEQALGVGDEQGSLACCSPWHNKESDTTERLNWMVREYRFLEILAYVPRGRWTEIPRASLPIWSVWGNRCWDGDTKDDEEDNPVSIFVKGAMAGRERTAFLNSMKKNRLQCDKRQRSQEMWGNRKGMETETIWQTNSSSSSKSSSQGKYHLTELLDSNRVPRHIFTKQDCGD